VQSTDKKICLLSNSLAKGGAERSCSLLSQMLSNAGFEVFLVVLNDAVDYEYKGTLFNLGQSKKGKDTFIHRLQRMVRLRRFLVENNIEVVIDHRPKNHFQRERFYKHFVYRNIKTVYVYHTSKKEECVTEQPKKYAALFDTTTIHVGVSKHIEEEILGKAKLLNTVTIHNAFDDQWDASQALPASLQGEKYVLFYGRLVDEVKDLKFLLRSFKASGISEKGYKLVLLGNGPDEAMLRNECYELGISEDVLFMPFMDNPASVISNAHCVVLTSKFEGFPMVLIESLSLGVPVISLDMVSGPNEIVKDGINGLLIKDRQEEAFAAGLQKMVLDTEFYENCKKASKDTVADFTPREIQKQWVSLLNT